MDGRQIPFQAAPADPPRQRGRNLVSDRVTKQGRVPGHLAYLGADQLLQTGYGPFSISQVPRMLLG